MEFACGLQVGLLAGAIFSRTAGPCPKKNIYGFAVCSTISLIVLIMGR